MALATSQLKDKALKFMTELSYPPTEDMLLARYKIDPNLRCRHVNCLECLTKVRNEMEWWFPPYAAFQATRLRRVGDGPISYWELDVKVSFDNLSPHVSPGVKLAPWA